MCSILHLKVWGAEPSGRGTIFTRSGQFICFASDMDIIRSKCETLGDLFTRLKREETKLRLGVERVETKNMLVGGAKQNMARPGSHVTIDENRIF